MKFTTRDRDNDKYSYNCALRFGGNAGGWWHNQCSHLYPNHQYNHYYSVYLNSQWHSLPFIEMKIRLLNCKI